jgi:WD40 repeat protein
MNNYKTKNKNWLIFLLVIVMVMILMFIANIRSFFKTSLSIPPVGVTRLYTVGNSLVAVLPDNQLYIWGWQNLKDRPTRISSPSNNALWISEGKLVYVPVDNANTIAVFDSVKKEEIRSFRLDSQWVFSQFDIDRNGQFVVVAFEEKSPELSDNDKYKNIRIVMLSKDSNNLTTIVDLNKIDLKNSAVSDDGRYIAVVGREDNIGWMAVINVKDGQIVWQKSINEVAELTEIIFSSKGDVIYTAGVGRNIYVFKVGDGDLVNQFQVDENIVAQKRQNISTIAVTDNGHLLGASTEPSGTVYIWNLVTGKRVYTDNPGMTITSGLAFSPDSSLFAVSDIQINPVKIFKCP